MRYTPYCCASSLRFVVLGYIIPDSASGAKRFHIIKKIYYSEEAIDQFFVDTFIKTPRKVPKEIILDLDATDDPIHGHREGRFFHGYFDCYCYLPLYMSCRDKLMFAKLKTANLDPDHESLPDIVRVKQQIRAHWPKVRIILRGDSGLCREDLMRWFEENDGKYSFNPSTLIVFRAGHTKNTLL